MKLENFIVISHINLPLGLSTPSPSLGALIPCVHSQKNSVYTRTSWNKCVTLRFIHLRHRHTNFSIAIHQETIWAIQLIKRDKNPTIPTQNWKFAILNSKLIRCGNALFLIFTSSFPTPAFFKIKKVQFEGLWERLPFF